MSGLSFNQPKLCPNASWNPNATIFAKNVTVGSQPQAVFVDTNNTVHVVAQALNQVLIWSAGNNITIRNISGAVYNPLGIFVTTNGDVYIDNGGVHCQVGKWTFNATNGVAVMNVSLIVIGTNPILTQAAMVTNIRNKRQSSASNVALQSAVTELQRQSQLTDAQFVYDFANAITGL